MDKDQLVAEEETVPQEGNLKGKIEAILFVAGEPILISDLARALSLEPGKMNRLLRELKDEYDFQQRGFSLQMYGKHVQLTTRAMYAEDIVHLLQPVQRQTLSQAVMETLAVVAYRQPVTKAEVEAIRGVKCDYSIQSLVNKELICEVGRKEALGRPILYGTTDKFLQHFGLQSLSDLPPMSEESQTAEEQLIT